MSAPPVLVVSRAVDPDVPRHVDVGRSQPDDFTGTHGGELLQLDHGGDVGREVGQCCVNPGLGYGPDWFGFTGFGAAVTQSGDGTQGFVGAGRRQFFTDGPFEQAFDPVDAVVDHPPA